MPHAKWLCESFEINPPKYGVPSLASVVGVSAGMQTT